MSKHKRIDLPNTIKVMWRDITINREAPTFKNDNSDEFGSYERRKNRINLQPELEGEILANVLIHEYLHVSIDDLSLNQETKETKLLTEDIEEMLVNSVANHFIATVKDNKWLLPFIQQCVHGETK